MSSATRTRLSVQQQRTDPLQRPTTPADPQNEGPTVSDDQKLTQESPPAVTSAFVAHVTDPFDLSIGT